MPKLRSIGPREELGTATDQLAATIEPVPPQPQDTTPMMPQGDDEDQATILRLSRRQLDGIDATASYFGLSRDETAQMIIDWGLETLDPDTWADPRNLDTTNTGLAEVIDLAARRDGEGR